MVERSLVKRSVDVFFSLPFKIARKAKSGKKEVNRNNNGNNVKFEMRYFKNISNLFFDCRDDESF